MFKRAVRDAVRSGAITPSSIAGLTDDTMMQVLERGGTNRLAAAIRARKLYKRALDLPASEVPVTKEAWIADDSELTANVEDALAREVGLDPGELLLDFPARSDLLGVNLPLRLRDGGVERLTNEGRAGHVGLPRIADELYQSARRLRVFIAKPVRSDFSGVADLVGQPAEKVRELLAKGSLLGR
jgi:hypothetical protein